MVPAPIELKRGMGSSTTDRKFRSTDRGGACSRSRSATAAAALNDHRNLAAFDTFAAVSRARGAPIPGSSEAERPARAAWSALRLLATSSFLFCELLAGRFWFGADDGAQAVAADVGFAG